MNQKDFFEDLFALAELYTQMEDHAEYTVDLSLRRRVESYIAVLSDKDLYATLSVCIRERYLTDEYIQQGYGIKDVAGFIDWFDNSFTSNRKIKAV